MFIGESWLGSSARSLKEALGRRSDIELDDISEEAWFPRPQARWLRAINRLTAAAYRRDFNAAVIARVGELRPDVVVTYKGFPVRGDLVRSVQELGPLAVNVYPDCSPHAHGPAHREAVGQYDLVISTKVFHPPLWKDVYGYSNRCLFVPHGYDPLLHFRAEPPTELHYDVVMIATYRAEYGQLMQDFAKALRGSKVGVALAGFGWDSVRNLLPADWFFLGPLHGRSYVSVLRKGKICIAPVNRDVVINGKRQPSDVDTTRSYELAAAHCFFIHRRTDFARQLYSDDEVPMFDHGEELAREILFYLEGDAKRNQMASKAHARAVPAYSLDARAQQIVNFLRAELAAR